MIFDSKRREAGRTDMEATALAEAPARQRDLEAPSSLDPNRPMDRPHEPLQDDPRAIAARSDVAPARPPEAAATRVREDASEHDARSEAVGREGVELAPLFPSELAEQFRGNWNAVQIGFVDDPRQAVQQADALVKEVLRSLSETFSGERSRVEAQLAQAQPSTEDLRMALRRYRSFLHRLLAL